MRVVLDTGILIAALITRNTPPDFIYQAWRKKRFELITSEWQLSEFRRVSRSLLAVEDITVQGVSYTGCHKIMNRRSAAQVGGDQLNISWFCPNNVGLVKLIHTASNSSPGRSWTMEFDPSQSTP